MKEPRKPLALYTLGRWSSVLSMSLDTENSSASVYVVGILTELINTSLLSDSNHFHLLNVLF